MAGGTYNNHLKRQKRHGGGGDSGGNSSCGRSNSCRGRANDCRGHANECPGHWHRRNRLCHRRGHSNNCSMHSNICSERGKECLVLRAESSAHSAVLPPLLEEAHAPHSQSEAEEEEAMIRGLWVLVVMVVWVVVHAGCMCAVRPCCFVRLTCINAPKISKQRHIRDCRKALNETNQTTTFH
jgi:hypothetical protein